MKARAMALVLLVTAGVTACSTKSNIGGKAPSSVVTEPGSTTSSASATTGITSPPTTATAPRQNVQIVGKGFTQLAPDPIGDSTVTFAVLINNPNPASVAAPWIASPVNLNITFTNASGAVVDSESPEIDIALPGQTSAVTGSAQAKGVTSMTVQASVGNWSQNDRPITAGFTVTGVSTTTDQFGGSKTVGIIHSTFQKDYKQLHAEAVYESANGAILGGDDTFVDFAPANGQTSFSVDGLSGLPPGTAKTVVYAEFSSLSTFSS
jgi:hypothetical protein